MAQKLKKFVSGLVLEDLRKKLKTEGVECGPITASTRVPYEKKLLQILKEKDIGLPEAKEEIELTMDETAERQRLLEEIEELTDEELREKLEAEGAKIGRISESSRPTYQKKLVAIMFRNQTCGSRPLNSSYMVSRNMSMTSQASTSYDNNNESVFKKKPPPSALKVAQEAASSTTSTPNRNKRRASSLYPDLSEFSATKKPKTDSDGKLRAVEARCQRLEAENEELQKELSDMHEEKIALNADVRALTREREDIEEVEASKQAVVKELNELKFAQEKASDVQNRMKTSYENSLQELKKEVASLRTSNGVLSEKVNVLMKEKMAATSEFQRAKDFIGEQEQTLEGVQRLLDKHRSMLNKR